MAAVVFTALIPSMLFALPGIISDSPDASGQYIFYRDTTFSDDTYIGFLVYDDSTLALRVFSVSEGLTETGDVAVIKKIDITTYLRLDTTTDYISIIGESFPPNLSEDEINSINYAHDMLYELSARRKRLNHLSFSQDFILSQEFLQFGGNVNLCWQFYIPLFNLRMITSEEGEPLFEAVTMGILENSEDTSFQDFSGFSETAPSLIAAKKIPAADKAIDDQWMQLYPYVRAIDSAIHAAVNMACPDGSAAFMKTQAQNFLQSMSGSYVYLPNSTLSCSSDGLYSKVLYAPVDDSGKWTCAIRKIKPLDEVSVSYQELNCYTDYYCQHSAYLEDMLVRWDTILKSSER